MIHNIPHILEKVIHEPWLITVGGYETISRVIESKLAGITFEAKEEEGFNGTWVKSTIDSDGIATIPVQGILGQRMSSLEKMCGGSDYLDIQKATQDTLGKGARGILYSFDSNGGMTRGCGEMANYIKGLPVPTQAFTDSKCNSAAYYLACGCNNIMATESSDVGSIGVILPWIDKTKIWEVQGAKFEPFVNEGATLKGAGLGPSMTEAQKKHLQEMVDFAGEQFHEFVNSNRKVKPVVFKAGSYFGKQALEMGLIDSVGLYADAHKNLLTRCQKSRLVPGPGGTNKIQGSKVMTIDELKVQHPELYAQMVQDQKIAAEAAAAIAIDAARAAERGRLSELDSLNHSPECLAIINEAKAGNKAAKDIAVQIVGVLAKEVTTLRTQVGVYKGAHKGAQVPSIDPSVAEDDAGAEQKLSAKMADVFQKRLGRGAKANGSN